MLGVSVAEFHIRLQYISKQHTGAENAFLLRIFERCAAKTHIFSYATRSESSEGGGQDEVHAHPKNWPKWRLWNLLTIVSHLGYLHVEFLLVK